MPRGATVRLVTPGQNQKHYLAGALEPKTGRVVSCTSTRKTNVLFRALLDRLEWRYPEAKVDKVYVVVDNSGIPKAKAVDRWLAAPPRFELLFLPTSCPQANPLERAFGEVHDKCTRNHQRQRIEDVVWDVERHLSTNGPWQYKLSQLYYPPQVTAAVERITNAQQLPQAA
jgi:putative transposase